MKAHSRFLLAGFVGLLLGTTVAAQDSDPSGSDDFFSNGKADLISKPDNTATKSQFQDTFTKEQPISFGGNFEFSLLTGVAWYRDWSKWDPQYFWGDHIDLQGDTNSEKKEDSLLKLDGSLFFSARPTDTLRLYGKVKYYFPFTLDAASYSQYLSGQSTTTVTNPFGPSSPSIQNSNGSLAVPDLQIWELYADFDLGDKVFIRAGKQVVKWSANQYAFFSPADVISITPIDVTNLTADREGPVAIKTNVPFGSNNFDFYAIVPNGQLTSIRDAKLASRLQVVAGPWELGVGGAYSWNEDLKLVATASGSIWKFGLFGEALVNRTAQGGYLSPNGNPGDYSNYSFQSSRSNWFFSGTAGITYDNKDIYLDQVLVQYYYNGMGYAGYNGYGDAARAAFYGIDTRHLTQDQLTSALSTYTGQHYLAASFKESFVEESKISVGAYVIANLSDGSGFVTPNITFQATDEFSIMLDGSVYYGGENTEFRGLRQAALGFTNTQGLANSLQGQAFRIGITFNLGTGSF